MIATTNAKGERTYFSPLHVTLVRNKWGTTDKSEIVMVNGEVIQIDREQVANTVRRIEEGI